MRTPPPTPSPAALRRLHLSYQQTLHRHVRRPAPKLDAARRLGKRAMKLGMDTLELARLHEKALAAALLPDAPKHHREGVIGHACAFFAEALAPIEETHRGAREADHHLRVIVETLTERTMQLAEANAELKHENERRKAVETSLRASEEQSHTLLETSRRMQEDMRLLSRRVLSAQEEERKRISRELHDVIAQTLTGIHVRLAALAARASADTRALHQKIRTTQRLVEKSVDMIHQFARDLRPAVLDDLGLVPALRSCLKRFAEQTGVHTRLQADASIEKLDTNTRTVLYRVAQEALVNVAQHAKASNVSIGLRLRKGIAHMEVRDDGRGFLVDDDAFIKRSKRLGLLGMRERTEMVGGTFCIDSAPGRHTAVRVRIPHHPSPRKKAAPASACDSDTMRCT
jgi:signal transduction histidine kinase